MMLIVSAVQCEYGQLTPSVKLTKCNAKGKELGRHTSLIAHGKNIDARMLLKKFSLATNFSCFSLKLLATYY